MRCVDRKVGWDVASAVQARSSTVLHQRRQRLPPDTVDNTPLPALHPAPSCTAPSISAPSCPAGLRRLRSVADDWLEEARPVLEQESVTGKPCSACCPPHLPAKMRLCLWVAILLLFCQNLLAAAMFLLLSFSCSR